MQKITTTLKFTDGSFLEFYILKLLSGRTYSVPELTERFKATGYDLKMGSLYPLLTRFRRNGFVDRGYEDGDTSVVIRTYQLTGKGRKRLAELKSDWNRLNSFISSL